MEREPFGVAVVLNLLDEFVEIVVGAAMGGEDFERAAPGDAGVGDGVELLWVGMEGEFVEDAVTAFAGVTVGSAGHGMDVQFVGESEDVGGMALVIDEVRAQIEGAQVERVSEVFAVVDEEFSLEFIARGNPAIVARLVQALAQDQAASGGPSPSDLAGLLGEFEAGVVVDPFCLIGEEQIVMRRNDFGFHGCGWFSGFQVFTFSSARAGLTRWSPSLILVRFGAEFVFARRVPPHPGLLP